VGWGWGGVKGGWGSGGVEERALFLLFTIDCEVFFFFVFVCFFSVLPPSFARPPSLSPLVSERGVEVLVTLLSSE
jgi:hypothetical protein